MSTRIAPLGIAFASAFSSAFSSNFNSVFTSVFTSVFSSTSTSAFALTVSILAVVLLTIPTGLSAQAFLPTGASTRTFLQVDQFGYLPEESKVAILADPQIGFDAGDDYTAPTTVDVRRVTDDSVILTVPTTLHEGGSTDPASGDRGWWADFSDLQSPGTYYLYDALNDERSHPFEIGDDVWGDLLRTACRMFYYNRCGTEKPGAFAGSDWSDAFCFPQDSQTRDIANPGDPARYKNLIGGWFDAGDFNKYVTFAHSAVHDLLSAYEENPDAFTDDNGIPESGNGIPDLLDELRWELDWLLRMNNPDGSTHIKVGSVSFDQNTGSPPSVNDDPRYYGPTCSSASIAAASMFGHAALVFETVPGAEDFATLLATHAATSWNWALPFFQNGTLETNCDDGSILAGDADWSVDEQVANLVVAAVYLFELTAGDPVYGQFIIDNVGSTEPIAQGFWGPYGMALNDALLRYTTLPDADPVTALAIETSLSNDASNNWSGYYGFDGRDLYRAFMPDWSYHWGSNLPRVHYGSLNLQLDRYGIPGSDPVSETEIARAHLHWLHGANPLGLCYLSNMYALGAESPLNQIYHNWFADGTIWDHALDSERGPAPGFVSGGPNSSFSVPEIQPPAGQPLQKSYLDFNDDWPNNSWEVSEPSISYQAGYVRLLASMVDADVSGVGEGGLPDGPSGGPPDGSIGPTEPTGPSDGRSALLRVRPNPSTGLLEVIDLAAATPVQVYDVRGRLVRSFGPTETADGRIDLSPMAPGIYLLEAGGRTARVVVRR